MYVAGVFSVGIVGMCLRFVRRVNLRPAFAHFLTKWEKNEVGAYNVGHGDIVTLHFTSLKNHLLKNAHAGASSANNLIIASRRLTCKLPS